MTSDPILVVDNEPSVRSIIAGTLESSGYAVESAVNGNEALDKFTSRNFSMIIADAGMEILCKVKKMSPQTPVIMVTGSGSVNNAVEAMQAGASDYILKPFSSDTIKMAVKRVCKDVGRSLQHSDGADLSPDHLGSKRMIACSPKMHKILELAGNIASSRSTVLIQGESGTGKEVLAAFIHHNSGRRHKPFVAVNCAALPDTLAESELFGHEKGAFTGAFSRKAGKFEQAGEGTILLDEISEMSLPLQVKLLRVLQEHQVDRIGGEKPVSIDTRVIAVSNVDLKKAVEEGSFRKDLFYRVNVIPITLPPLRERTEDIPPLASFFLEKYSSMNGGDMKQIADEAMMQLLGYPWQGNVRELENTIERAVLLGNGDTLLPDHLMLEPMACGDTGGMSIQAGISVKEMEKRLIFHTLKEVEDNRTHAAEMLGISIRTLRNKLNEYRKSA